MQKFFTPKTPENASTEPVGTFDLLLTAESKAIGLHTMATALSELLECNRKDDLTATRRRMAAAFQVGWAVEEMADDIPKAIHEAMDLARDAATADTPSAAVDVKRTMSEIFRCECSHDQMVDFTDQLLTIIHELCVARLALTNKDWVGEGEDIDSIGLCLDSSYEWAKALHVDMHRCFTVETGRPPRRQPRTAEAGAQ